MTKYLQSIAVQNMATCFLAAGLGFWGARFAMGAVQLDLYGPIGRAAAREVGIGFVGATAALAVLVLHFLRAGGQFWRRARSPGIIGCCAILFCMLVEFAWLTEDAWLGRPEWGFLFLFLCGFSPQNFALAVVGAWVALLANRRWRPRGGIVDWAGLLVGLSMILWTTYRLWFLPNG